MANFFEELWGSIFTPGPTPTLLVATNITFGALLVLLLSLLVATWSIHFLILSVLSIGLWAGINWFAREVSLVQAQEEHQFNKDGGHATAKSDRGSESSKDGMDSGDDTETEVNDAYRQREATPQVTAPMRAPPTRITDDPIQSSAISSGATIDPDTVSRLTTDASRDMRKRPRQSMAESIGSLSTDSEWEKVDDDR